MGKLQEKVRDAFKRYNKSKKSKRALKQFVKTLCDASDVGYQWHRGIVDSEIDTQFKEMVL